MVSVSIKESATRRLKRKYGSEDTLYGVATASSIDSRQVNGMKSRVGEDKYVLRVLFHLIELPERLILVLIVYQNKSLRLSSHNKHLSRPISHKQSDSNR